MAATAPTRFATAIYNGDNTNLVNPTILTTDGVDTAEVTYNVKIPAGIAANNYIAILVKDPRIIKAVKNVSFHSLEIGGTEYPLSGNYAGSTVNNVYPAGGAGVRAISFALLNAATPLPVNYYVTFSLLFGRADITHS